MGVSAPVSGVIYRGKYLVACLDTSVRRAEDNLECV